MFPYCNLPFIFKTNIGKADNHNTDFRILIMCVDCTSSIIYYYYYIYIYIYMYIYICIYIHRKIDNCIYGDVLMMSGSCLDDV